ncbi:MAG TPA: hypothetical protein VG429_00665 [Casimicrobiaceae bacterium]|nr:hypothetical protein [Casimicrobiaceae bacterium]
MRSLFCLLLLSTAALAEDSAFLRCRGIADAAARLACYDALPVPESSPVAAQPGALPQQTPEQFGMERAPHQIELPNIESRIPGHFDGWQSNTRIRLANGQVWQIVDGSSRILDLTDPKVTIRRAAIGAFYLEFEGDNRTARVKRVQ